VPVVSADEPDPSAVGSHWRAGRRSASAFTYCSVSAIIVILAVVGLNVRAHQHHGTAAKPNASPPAVGGRQSDLPPPATGHVFSVALGQGPPVDLAMGSSYLYPRPAPAAPARGRHVEPTRACCGEDAPSGDPDCPRPSQRPVWVLGEQGIGST
jgi:hypothetical protein